MSLRLAFDLDGVLADMGSALSRQAGTLFGEAIAIETRPAGPSDAQDESASPEADSPEDDAGSAPKVANLWMTPRQERRLWHHVSLLEGFWESLDEIEPGAVARLATLARERKWDVIFLTTRPESAGATAQVQTQRWLEAKGFSLPSVFVVRGSRGRVADALGLDFVVDDRPRNCLDVVVDSTARALLVWRQDEKDVPVAARRPGISIVRSVEDCLAILADLDSSSRLRPGLVNRMLQRLGLRKANGAAGL